ncbi:hypothetical protein [Lysobacter sp. TY2-98]|uniref:hypothetical protein n=1 Tax=Lysobacter sp. TY2-98 TaxID=2290922 RepID=UPI0013B40011|nr:hypothetical protein [Lysobacter sp. TY2-98]
MELFRAPGIEPQSLSVLHFGTRGSRRYGYLRALREPDAPAANDADALPAPSVDQEFEEYFFE